MKPALLPIDVSGSTLFEKMDNLFRSVIQVSKTEIDRRRGVAEAARTKQKAEGSEALMCSQFVPSEIRPKNISQQALEEAFPGDSIWARILRSLAAVARPIILWLHPKD
jgi:hypothetical protein